MTESEAIMIIDNKKPSCGEKIIFAEGDRCEAIEMAINALEGIQKYRAIGTVEECRAAMEKQTARKGISTKDKHRSGYKKIWGAVCIKNYVRRLVWMAKKERTIINRAGI